MPERTVTRDREVMVPARSEGAAIGHWIAQPCRWCAINARRKSFQRKGSRARSTHAQLLAASGLCKRSSTRSCRSSTASTRSKVTPSLYASLCQTQAPARDGPAAESASASHHNKPSDVRCQLHMAKPIQSSHKTTPVMRPPASTVVPLTHHPPVSAAKPIAPRPCIHQPYKAQRPTGYRTDGALRMIRPSEPYGCQQAQTRLKTSVPLVPPKPKLFFIAKSILMSRATLAQ